MSVIPLIIEASKLTIAAIFLFYVVEMVTPMPLWARRVVQALIILIVVLNVLQMATAGEPAHAMRPLSPLPAGPPSICKGC